MYGALGFAMFLFFSVSIFLLVKNKDNIKKVSYKNRLIVVVVFFCLLLFSTLAIFNGGDWLTGFIGHETWKLAVRMIWTFIIVAIISKVWESLLRKVKRDSGIV